MFSACLLTRIIHFYIIGFPNVVYGYRILLHIFHWSYQQNYLGLHPRTIRRPWSQQDQDLKQIGSVEDGKDGKKNKENGSRKQLNGYPSYEDPIGKLNGNFATISSF